MQAPSVELGVQALNSSSESPGVAAQPPASRASAQAPCCYSIHRRWAHWHGREPISRPCGTRRASQGDKAVSVPVSSPWDPSSSSPESCSYPATLRSPPPWFPFAQSWKNKSVVAILQPFSSGKSLGAGSWSVQKWAPLAPERCSLGLVSLGFPQL